MLMTDRVSERCRAAQLARHYRDQEGLTIAEIARRLGRAEAPTPSAAPERLGVNAVEIRTGGYVWPSVNGPDGRRQRYGHSSAAATRREPR